MPRAKAVAKKKGEEKKAAALGVKKAPKTKKPAAKKAAKKPAAKKVLLPPWAEYALSGSLWTFQMKS